MSRVNLYLEISMVGAIGNRPLVKFDTSIEHFVSRHITSFSLL